MKKHCFYLLLCLLATGLFSACSSDDNNDNDGNGGNGNGNEIENGTILKGTITSDVTLAAGNTYKLSGEYIVEEGATLHIEEGVKIIAVYDDIADYILVKQGGKINAVGTPDKPIVMTSEKEEPGAWGGIHICGRAHTNAEGGKGSSEIGGAVYGGNDDADNSGTLQYIRGVFFHILGHNDLQSSFDYVYVDVLSHYHRISIEMYNPLFGTMDAERLTAESLYTAILVDSLVEQLE